MDVTHNRSVISDKRTTPLKGKASDFIVNMVLKNERILLRGQSDRFLSANEHRKDVWKTISKKLFEKFDVALTPKQVQQHFNNRKRKALSLEIREKKYRKKTGGGRELEEEAIFKEENVSKTEFELKSYYNQRTTARGLPNADTLRVNEFIIILVFGRKGWLVDLEVMNLPPAQVWKVSM
ncbi:unnamed protein product [Cylicocyclus nassatus]|uniref:Regulatory protein zeste n=1 Tax=Cylicocyclus nassatus TaxID=53992 RepID=A0AA36HA59_CYLNA|nr:unnamed protein product [Cylicocyclus nassatus]